MSLLALPPAEARENIVVDAYDQNQNLTVVAGSVEPDFSSCKATAAENAEFVFDEKNQSLWIVDHGSARSAVISEGSIREWSVQRGKLESVKTEMIEELRNDPNIPADFKVLIERYSQSKALPNPGDIKVQTKPAASAKAMPEFTQLMNQLKIYQRLITQEFPDNGLLAATFACYFDIDQVPFVATANANRPYEITFAAHPLSTSQDSWRSYKNVRLWEMFTNAETDDYISTVTEP